MSRRPNEDYIDHWLLHVREGSIEVDKDTMKTVRRAIEVNTVEIIGTHDEDVRGMYVRPIFLDITDLMDGETAVRLDEVRLITHWTPEWRDNYRALKAAKKEIDPDDKPFD